MRRLQVTRRHVPLDTLDEYVMAWQRTRSAVESVGGRAWLFRGAAHQDQFLEFIEWSLGDVSPLHDVGVSAAVAQLSALGASHTPDEWEEAP